MHDQLRVSRQLTEQKVYDPDSEDDENLKTVSTEELPLLKASSDNTDNPWLLGNDSSSSKGFCNIFVSRCFFMRFSIFQSPTKIITTQCFFVISLCKQMYLMFRCVLFFGVLRLVS